MVVTRLVLIRNNNHTSEVRPYSKSWDFTRVAGGMREQPQPPASGGAAFSVAADHYGDLIITQTVEPLHFAHLKSVHPWVAL